MILKFFDESASQVTIEVFSRAVNSATSKLTLANTRNRCVAGIRYSQFLTLNFDDRFRRGLTGS